MSQPAARRLRVEVSGAVQGVGFRPFVYRLATDLGLHGWVGNTPGGVCLEVEGPEEALDDLLRRLPDERPPAARIDTLATSFLPAAGDRGFVIRGSALLGEKTAVILPDLATCADCLREVLDPADRRYRYPFTNCTRCGPRFSIILSLPYDRPRTTMGRFTMCPACQAEYEDPRDRRFHAQPNACPRCGPQLCLWNAGGETLASGDAALGRAAGAIRDGAVVALKGLGGFQLLVDARAEAAVRRLRQRKRRDEKPFALMYPGAGPSLAQLRSHCQVSAEEERLLVSAEAPIVLVRRRAEAALAPAVAPDNPLVGAMLPCTPLHHLLLGELGFPVVATSGNLAEEPLCTDEREALVRLAGIADLWLCHDRPIARGLDDSIVRVVAGRPLVLRRARGYAPLPVPLPVPSLGHAVLAVGAQQKSTVAVTAGQRVILSQHLGDLGTVEAQGAFDAAVRALTGLYETRPAVVAHDLHPDYSSTRAACHLGARRVGVQHHHAHVLSCLLDNGIAPPVLGVAWDGSGWGPDGTVWGGEFLLVRADGFERLAHLRTFPLPGGERAIREPRRAALGLLYEARGDALFSSGPQVVLDAFSPAELGVLRQALRRGVNAPRTSSVGRLCDAVAALLGLRQRMSFEAQAAMELEFTAAGHDQGSAAKSYPVELRAGPAALVVDWGPLVDAILSDLQRGVPRAAIAAAFHHALVDAIVLVARRSGEGRVVLSGGCFQNQYLTERAIERLQKEGLCPYWHRHVPPNDGGIALGQVAAIAFGSAT